AGLKHGEAVALGLIAETVIGERVGVTLAGTAAKVTAVLRAFGLPIRASGLPTTEVIAAAMLADKKVRGGRLVLAVPSGDGRCRIVSDPSADAIRAGIDSIR